VCTCWSSSVRQPTSLTPSTHVPPGRSARSQYSKTPVSSSRGATASPPPSSECSCSRRPSSASGPPLPVASPRSRRRHWCSTRPDRTRRTRRDVGQRWAFPGAHLATGMAIFTTLVLALAWQLESETRTAGRAVVEPLGGRRRRFGSRRADAERPLRCRRASESPRRPRPTSGSPSPA